MIKNVTRLFIAIFCVLCFSSSAQNLLTNRQIYNYDVGDIFEYQQAIIYANGNSGPYNHIFLTVLSTRLSKGNDTVFYITKQRSYYRPDSANIYDKTDTVIESYTKLDSLGKIPTYVHTSKDSFSWTIDTFNGRIENKFYQISPNLPHREYDRIQNSWVEGLGEILTYEMLDGNGGSSTQLVYYKKKNEVYGTSFFAGTEPNKNQSTGLTIYPNPIKTGEKLIITGAAKGLNSVKIIDMTGKLIYSNSEHGPVIRELIHLSPAIYSVFINDGNEILTQKIVVIQ